METNDKDKEKEKEKSESVKDDKPPVKTDEKIENSDAKPKTETEEDVVIVKDDEEEGEKKEVRIISLKIFIMIYHSFIAHFHLFSLPVFNCFLFITCFFWQKIIKLIANSLIEIFPFLGERNYKFIN